MDQKNGLSSPKHEAMKSHFKTLVNQRHLDTKLVKFRMKELLQTFDSQIKKGITEFTVCFAAYENEEQAKEYADREKVNVKDVVNKCTLLVQNPGKAAGEYLEMATLCPPPDDCGNNMESL